LLVVILMVFDLYFVCTVRQGFWASALKLKVCVVSVLHLTFIGQVCDVIAWAMCVVQQAKHCTLWSCSQISCKNICVSCHVYLSVCIEHCLTEQIFTDFMLGTSALLTPSVLIKIRQ